MGFGLTDLTDPALWQTALASVLSASVLSQSNAAVHAWTHQGISYSHTFVATLVVAGLISTMVILSSAVSMAMQEATGEL